MKDEQLKAEAGYSLVESIVALALFATVLVPLSSFLAGLTTHRISKQKIEALAWAQATMEEAILHAWYEDKTQIIGNNRWLVTEGFTRTNDLVLIKVSVFRVGRKRPHITLQTARLGPAMP